MDQHMIPESSLAASADYSSASNNSSLAWIPIDDSLGIWTEFRQTTSSSSMHHVEEDQHQQREEPSPIHNRPEFSSNNGDNVKASILVPSSMEADDSSATMDTKQPQQQKLNETDSSRHLETPLETPLAPTAATVNLRRTSSGRLWTGIRAGDCHHEQEEEVVVEVEAVLSDNDVDDDDLSLQRILGPIHDEDVRHQDGNQDDDLAPSYGEDDDDDDIIVPNHPHPQHHDSTSSLDPLQALLSEIISFDFLFGRSTSRQEEEEEEVPLETMGLRNNVNAEIAMGLELLQEAQETGPTVIISSSVAAAATDGDDSYLSRLGYTPGMQVTKINGQDVTSTSSLAEVHSKMELVIQVVDDFTKVTKQAIFGVHDQKMDFYVHKTKTSKDIFITKVEPNSVLEQAGFEPGMRVTHVNGRPCPSTFRELANLLTADIVAIPLDLRIPIGFFHKTISNLSVPTIVVEDHNVEEEDEDTPQEDQIIRHHHHHHHKSTNKCHHHPSSNLLLDLQKSFWLQGRAAGGGGGGLMMMIAA